MGRVPFSLIEQDHIWAGRQQLEYGAVPRSFRYSPLPNIISAAPMRIDANRVPAKNPTLEYVRNEVRRILCFMFAAFLVCSSVLVPSIVCVSHRLFGELRRQVARFLYFLLSVTLFGL